VLLGGWLLCGADDVGAGLVVVSRVDASSLAFWVDPCELAFASLSWHDLVVKRSSTRSLDAGEHQ